MVQKCKSKPMIGYCGGSCTCCRTDMLEERSHTDVRLERCVSWSDETSGGMSPRPVV
jgi:hypothetical protein